MSDERDALLWNFKPTTAPRQPKPGELLFDFTRHDGTAMRCELHFNGESAGWEARFVERGGHEFYAHGGFALKEWAVRWAERERDAMVLR